MKWNTDLNLQVPRWLLAHRCYADAAERLRENKWLNLTDPQRRLDWVFEQQTLTWTALGRLHNGIWRAQEIMTMIKRSFNWTNTFIRPHQVHGVESGLNQGCVNRDIVIVLEVCEYEYICSQLMSTKGYWI
jgi:hypothetical protein